MSIVKQMTPSDLSRRQRSGDDIALIDVREPWEWSLGRIGGAELIPLGELEAAVPRLDHAREVVLYCHHGMRSQMAAEYLVAHGFHAVWNLAGGIARWSEEVDSAVALY